MEEAAEEVEAEGQQAEAWVEKQLSLAQKMEKVEEVKKEAKALVKSKMVVAKSPMEFERDFKAFTSEEEAAGYLFKIEEMEILRRVDFVSVTKIFRVLAAKEGGEKELRIL